MGVAPPIDAPPPGAQAGVAASISFEPSPTGATLCGFGIPSFSFSLVLNIPFPIINFPPTFNFSIGLNCDLSNPIDADFSFGGGRIGQSDPDADDEFQDSPTPMGFPAPPEVPELPAPPATPGVPVP